MAVFGKGRGKKQFSSKASLAFYEVDEYRKKLKKQIEEEESEIMYACEICGKKAGSPWAKCVKCGGDVSRMEQATDVSNIMDKRENESDSFGKEGTFSSPPPPPKPKKREGKGGLITFVICGVDCVLCPGKWGCKSGNGYCSYCIFENSEAG